MAMRNGEERVVKTGEFVGLRLRVAEVWKDRSNVWNVRLNRWDDGRSFCSASMAEAEHLTRPV